MSYDIPYGNPSEMREFARKLRVHAESVENIVAPIILPGPNEFRGRVADSFRARRQELRQAASAQRDRLFELASWLDSRAADLERQIEEAKRQAEEAERRRRELMSLWPWPWGR